MGINTNIYISSKNCLIHIKLLFFIYNFENIIFVTKTSQITIDADCILYMYISVQLKTDSSGRISTVFHSHAQASMCSSASSLYSLHSYMCFSFRHIVLYAGKTSKRTENVSESVTANKRALEKNCGK